MDAQKVLESILADYVRDYKASRVIQAIDRKIEKGIYRYSEAEMLAQESGRILESAFRKYLPEALTDGKLFRATAEVVLKNPMLQGSRDVRNAAVRIQRGLNEQAGIGINAIVPEVNEDQINGIITGICNAQSFEAEEEKLYDQVGNFLEGYVDDFVHDNAEFQYQAGLDPYIERISTGKCCKWCDGLTGTYPYEKVRDRGNDVFRRHNNCHCVISYNPGNGSKKRQNVHSKRWTAVDEEELRERQIHFGERRDFEHDYKHIRGRKIENYRENNLYIDQDVNLSPKEIRRINNQISQAKELHGIVGQCDARMVIVNESKRLAAYNPRTNELFISSKLADTKNVLKLQNGYACSGDQRSTMVHELFHWKDAATYRQNIGAITDASRLSDYSIFQGKTALEELKKAGIDLSDLEKVEREISKYAADALRIDNDFEEAYTEYRTKALIEGGRKR